MRINWDAGLFNGWLGLLACAPSSSTPSLQMYRGDISIYIQPALRMHLTCQKLPVRRSILSVKAALPVALPSMEVTPQGPLWPPGARPDPRGVYTRAPNPAGGPRHRGRNTAAGKRHAPQHGIFADPPPALQAGRADLIKHWSCTNPRLLWGCFKCLRAGTGI